MTKIESTSTQLSNKDREIAMLKSKLESSIEDQDKRKKTLDEAKSEMV